MAFEIDIGFASRAGRKDINEDFCAAMLPEAGQEAMGSIVAIADGVSTGGMGKEAAQTTVTSLVRDYYGTPETWDTTVALDRIIGAQNSWLAGLNRPFTDQELKARYPRAWDYLRGVASLSRQNVASGFLLAIVRKVRMVIFAAIGLALWARHSGRQ